MSKSLGNHIPLLSTPEDMYGKVMSIPDKAMRQFFRLLTRWTPPEIAEMERKIQAGDLHPRDAKMKLAFEIVSIYHSQEEANQAQSNFIRIFQQKNSPAEMPHYTLKKGQTILDVLVAAKMVSSKSEGRRMLTQNAVRLDKEILTDATLPFPHSGVLQVGKRHFIHIDD